MLQGGNMVPTPDADPPSLEDKGADGLSVPTVSGERQGLGSATVILSWLSKAAAAATATATLYWDNFITSQPG